MAISTKKKMDKTTEIKAGIINSAGMTSLEIKSTFLDFRINGLNLEIGSIIPSKDIRATMLLVKSMLVKVCLNITHPIIRILKYRNPIIQSEKAAKATWERFL